MEDWDNKKCRLNSVTIDDVIEIVMLYIIDPKDRESVSLVSRRWCKVDGDTREHVKMALCYTAKPDRLSRRFPNLKSLKLKGKPRADMFNLIPENWGGYVTPWVYEIMTSFRLLKSVHFRRMIVSDLDLYLLAKAKKDELEALNLDMCCGFSTDGLLSLARHCRKIKTLLMEASSFIEKDGEWLTEFALHNTSLEVFNFYLVPMAKINPQDLVTIARNCQSLVSLKLGDCEILDIVGVFKAAANLEEFCGGSFNQDPDKPDKYLNLSFPPKIWHLGLSSMGTKEMPIIFPFAAQLRKLDLVFALLDTDDHCTLIQKCPNLEVLQARTVIGDRGLEVLAGHCKRLKRLTVEKAEDENGMDDEEGLVSQRGLIALAQGCLELEYLAVFVSDIDNQSLRIIGAYLKNLCDFRLSLLDLKEIVTDLPLDNGVLALLRGCEKLRKFALYLRQGGLTDTGLSYIGQYSPNLRWMFLGFLGESDEGLLRFSAGCPSLRKLEMRGCCFSEHAIAVAVTRLTSLRYLWVQAGRISGTGRHLSAMVRPFWNIELIPAIRVTKVNRFGRVREGVLPSQIIAYYSLAGPRRDFPPTVIPFDPCS